jgi:putative aldouronate transport system permease protein
MQNVLLSVINEARQAEALAAIRGGLAAAAMGGLKSHPVNVRSVTMATMFVTIFPVVIAYPFLQRYFIKGMMIGSIKG